MNDADIVALMREINFLDEVSDENMAALAAITRLVEFPEAQVLFREGDVTDDIYIVVDGQVSLEICASGVGCRRIMTVSSGELLGWSPLLEQARLTATARTIAPTSALQISANQILTLCEHNPRFGYEFMRRMALALAKRLSAARIQLLNVYGS